MPRFRFSLESLLMYRRTQRDLCRQLLGRALAQDAELAAQQAEWTRQRAEQLDELRKLGEAGAMEVERSASRRYHAGRLSVEIRQVELAREQAARQIELCRQALVRADQSVKALENLAAKQHAEYLAAQERRESREREENWLAAHITEVRA